MQRYLYISAALAGLAAAAACATAPPVSSRITAAEAALTRANSDPVTHDLGRDSLNDAAARLEVARDALRAHDDEAFTHAIRMAETDISLAEARSDQRKTEQAIDDIEDQQSLLQLSSRDRAVTRAEDARDRAERATTIATAGQARAELETRSMRAELADYQLRETSLGMVLVLQDLQFAIDSSVLREGARARLDPLAAYLANNTSARIRIAGHADSSGGLEHNRALSQRRASAVADYLVTRGADGSHIEAVGMGESSPVASNGTTSGREENRRVEVTILKS